MKDEFKDFVGPDPMKGMDNSDWAEGLLRHIQSKHSDTLGIMMDAAIPYLKGALDTATIYNERPIDRLLYGHAARGHEVALTEERPGRRQRLACLDCQTAWDITDAEAAVILKLVELLAKEKEASNAKG